MGKTFAAKVEQLDLSQQEAVSPVGKPGDPGDPAGKEAKQSQEEWQEAQQKQEEAKARRAVGHAGATRRAVAKGEGKVTEPRSTVEAPTKPMSEDLSNQKGNKKANVDGLIRQKACTKLNGVLPHAQPTRSMCFLS